MEFSNWHPATGYSLHNIFLLLESRSAHDTRRTLRASNEIRPQARTFRRPTPERALVAIHRKWRSFETGHRDNVKDGTPIRCGQSDRDMARTHESKDYDPAEKNTPRVKKV